MTPRGTKPVLPTSTSDRIAKLARLLTTTEMQPFAMKWTKKVLPDHQKHLQDRPMPEDGPLQKYPGDTVSLRDPI